ncbi:sensor histidine kinase [Sphaerothrix gracilis]|uniref:sensor histidine kinase n=1 Tax=Sphaerothrix gracilis TaxID=3151835 RepID=UPI0031FD28CE
MIFNSRSDTQRNYSQSIEAQAALLNVITKVRQSLDLNTILMTTAVEVRQLLQADRVGILRLDPVSGWGDGEFIAEAVAPEFDAALAQRVRDRCFGDHHAHQYEKGRIQALNDIYAAGLSDCHLQILERFQVRANLLIPLLEGERLWGLLCVHQCSGPRRWQQAEIGFAADIATHLSVAIQQAELLTKTQQQSAELSALLHELQLAHVQLAQQEKLSSIGQLAAGIAHEINNPASFIVGNLVHFAHFSRDLLKLLDCYRRHYPQPVPEIQALEASIDLDFWAQDITNLLRSMKQGAKRIQKTVLSLRNFVRLGESKLKTVDIHEGIDNALLILQHRLQGHPEAPQIAIIKDYGTLPPVECYPGKLNQAIMSLLINAVEALEEEMMSCHLPSFSPKEGGATESFSVSTPPPPKTAQISIRTAQIDEQWIEIVIADTGPGITDQARDRLYDPFFTTKPIGQGTGLGLAISQQTIVVEHGGRLEYRTQPHMGTEFQIQIPIRQNPACLRL